MKRYVVLLMTLLAVVGAACGEQSEPVSAATLAATPTTTPTATPEPTSTPPPTPTASPTPLPTVAPIPTASPTPESTAAPMPTPTASPIPEPTATATSTPSPIPLPAGPLSAAVLTLDDFPTGFEEVSPAELGLGEGVALLEGLIIESSFAFGNADTFEFVFGFTLLIPTALEQIGFDLALSQPEFLLGSVASGIVEEGTEITEQVALSDLDGFGEKSAGLAIAFNTEGIPFRMEMVAFRRETVGAFAAIMYFDGDTPIVPIDEAARRFDDRIVEVLSAGTPEAIDLSKSGKIDINSADIETLKKLPGIGDVKAQAIISYRETNGPFSNVEGLLDVRGIGPATLEALRDLVEVR